MQNPLRASTNATIALVVTGAFLIAWALVDAGIDRLSGHAVVASQRASALTTGTLAKSRAHALSLAREEAVRAVLNRKDSNDAEALGPMVAAFRTLLSRNPAYRQARWIDESGVERVKVVRDPEEAIVVVPDLQDKSAHQPVRKGTHRAGR